MKQCSKCLNVYPLTSEIFSRDVSHKDGFRSHCKTCEKAISKAYRDSHKEQKREHAKQYRQANKEKIASHKKQWQQGEAYKEYQKRYQIEHKQEISRENGRRYQIRREELCERQRQYIQTLQGRMVDKAHQQKRKAQKRASKGAYSSQQLRDQFRRQKAKCYYCKVKLSGVWHVDHVLPLSKGGTNTIENIVIACPTCNLHKAAKLPHEWPEGGRLL